MTPQTARRIGGITFVALSVTIITLALALAFATWSDVGTVSHTVPPINTSAIYVAEHLRGTLE